jgi:hypothetical protein
MMRPLRWLAVSVPALLLLAAVAVPAPPAPAYVKKGSRAETALASLKAAGLPTLEGPWYYVGPFDNTDNLGFDAVYPPEREIELRKTYKGKGGATVGWRQFKDFRPGRVVNLALFKDNNNSVIYLYHEIDAPRAVTLPLSLGSDDTLTVWLNGKRLLAEDAHRPAAPDQNEAELKLKPGKNRLLIKVCNGGGDWAVFVEPKFPPDWPAALRDRLARDFPTAVKRSVPAPAQNAEAAHYRIVDMRVPKEIVMEVGGLAVWPDGKLLACTRRGEVWLVSNPNAEGAERPKYELFASGLHEALGLCVDGKDVYVVQRPELTKLTSRDGEAADDFTTVCDQWGVSGDYHEFAFGPARDRKGNFFITLNVGFSGDHQSKAPWRGWCVKVTPKGELVPYATGLRSPNGVNFSPDGDLFYTDNQGEWVATNKLHHVREGDNYGHQAGLRWVKDSPFAKLLKDRYPSGLRYDGQAGTDDKGRPIPAGYPQLTPPAVWFPYGRMGQSASEPIWDTTGGKFGPFAGQCLVGDQTKAMVMRVYLEKVNGRYQGACFPFRSGFECGVNRLAFGPDGSLYVGMTARGWGSVGGKPYGLQRLVYTGVLPFEIHSMKLTKSGFDLAFTKPLDQTSADRLAAYSLQSFTYFYWPTYGSPEVDRRAEKVQGVTVSPDRRRVSLKVAGFRKGRVYELHLDGIKADDGSPVLHPEAYYTLNEVPD